MFIAHFIIYVSKNDSNYEIWNVLCSLGISIIAGIIVYYLTQNLIERKVAEINDNQQKYLEKALETRQIEFWLQKLDDQFEDLFENNYDLLNRVAHPEASEVDKKTVNEAIQNIRAIVNVLYQYFGVIEQSKEVLDAIKDRLKDLNESNNLSYGPILASIRNLVNEIMRRNNVKK